MTALSAAVQRQVNEAFLLKSLAGGRGNIIAWIFLRATLCAGELVLVC